MLSRAHRSTISLILRRRGWGVFLSSGMAFGGGAVFLFMPQRLSDAFYDDFYAYMKLPDSMTGRICILSYTGEDRTLCVSACPCSSTLYERLCKYETISLPFYRDL